MNALLIDDSRLARTELRHLLRGRPGLTVVGEARHADEARQRIQELRPELLFLDIQMPGQSGFDLLASLDAPLPHVIFTTAYDQYAVKAFEVSALDYLLKPVSESRLAAALAKLPGTSTTLSAPTQAPSPVAPTTATLTALDQVFVKEGERCWFVKLADIRLFEISGGATRVYFGAQQPLIPRTLQQLETRLDPKVFFRANRQQIINLHWVTGIEPWFSNTLKIKLREGPEVEVSRIQSGLFRELMSL
jgi:two-component system LytT family response regulator